MFVQYQATVCIIWWSKGKNRTNLLWLLIIRPSRRMSHTYTYKHIHLHTLMCAYINLCKYPENFVWKNWENDSKNLVGWFGWLVGWFLNCSWFWFEEFSNRHLIVNFYFQICVIPCCLFFFFLLCKMHILNIYYKLFLYTYLLIQNILKYVL